MHPRSRFLCGGLLALCVSLSCALAPPAPSLDAVVQVTPEAVPTATLPHGPSVADRIVARLAGYQTGLSPAEVQAVAEAIAVESERHGLDWQLVLAVIHTESGFYNFARSHVGALGLMQIMPATGEMLARETGVAWDGPETLFDPVVNVRFGTRYLAFLHARYDDWDAALAAYNWGPGAIDRRMARGTALPVLYVEKVTARLQAPPAP